MERTNDFWIFAMDLPVRTASALAGALLGGTAGMVGGPIGMALVGLGGALAGGLGGRWLERRAQTAALADVVPEIEPPCKDCVAARDLVGDAGATCAAHRKHRHGNSALHYEYPQTFAVGSMLLRDAY